MQRNKNKDNKKSHLCLCCSVFQLGWFEVLSGALVLAATVTVVPVIM